MSASSVSVFLLSWLLVSCSDHGALKKKIQEAQTQLDTQKKKKDELESEVAAAQSEVNRLQSATVPQTPGGEEVTLADLELKAIRSESERDAMKRAAEVAESKLGSYQKLLSTALKGD